MAEIVLLQVFVLMVSGALLIATIIALVRVSGVQQLKRRLEDLEDEVYRAHRRRPTAEEAVPVAEEAEPRRRQEPEDAVRHEPPPRRRPAPPQPQGAALEGVIGRKVLGWVAVVLLVFAVGFFVKYAFENQWIGPVGQVCCGAVAGAGLCVGGFVAHRRGRFLASQMLTSSGIAILYLATFATFGFYDLVPRERASVYLSLIVALSALLAVLYDARAIGWMALIGGLLAPILLAAPHDQYRSLFTYLAVLAAGTLTMSFVRRWHLLALAALLGVQGMFWLWFDSNFHPDKQPAALFFQGVLWATFLLHDAVLPALLRRLARPQQFVGMVLAAFFFALAGAITLSDEPWALLSALAVGLAIVYAVLTTYVRSRSPDDAWLQLTSVAISLAFLATAIGLRANAGWVALGWAIEGLALWWFGLRVRSLPLRLLGGVLLLLSLSRYLMHDAPWQARHLEWPVLNSDALPGLVIALCLIGAGWLTSRLPYLSGLDHLFRGACSLGGVLLAWLVLSLEVYHFATTRWPDETGTAVEGFQRAQAGLSVFWAIYAGVLIAAGFWRRLTALRILALCLFGLTTLKVFFIDMAGLPGIYRVVAFFVLAVVLGAAAYAYQRYEIALRSGAPTHQETADVPI